MEPVPVKQSWYHAGLHYQGAFIMQDHTNKALVVVDPVSHNMQWPGGRQSQAAVPPVSTEQGLIQVQGNSEPAGVLWKLMRQPKHQLLLLLHK